MTNTLKTTSSRRECRGPWRSCAVLEPPCRNTFEGQTWYHQRGYCSADCFNMAGHLFASGVPKKHSSSTLSTFEPQGDTLKKIHSFIRSWTEGDLEHGLLLYGNVGTGKTHLAVGAMRELFKRGWSGEFCNVRDFIMQCQSSFRPDTRRSVSEIVGDYLDGATFIVLDDIGSEKHTDFVRQSLLHLVDSAYSGSIRVIATSNSSPESLGKIDDRIASRLVEMCLPLRFDNPDYRSLIAERRAELYRADPAGEIQ